jgi:hypothetical protein
MKVVRGDRLLMVVPPGEAIQASTFPAEVIRVDESMVTCSVSVDLPRTMRFDRRTGWRDDREAFLIRVPG